MQLGSVGRWVFVFMLGVVGCTAEIDEAVEGGSRSELGQCGGNLYGNRVVIPDLSELRTRVPGEVSQWLRDLDREQGDVSDSQRLDAILDGEFATALEQMTGRSFQVVEASTIGSGCTAGIYLLPPDHPLVLNAAPAALRQRLSELDPESLDSFVIHSDGGDELWIVAREELGLLQGAFHYLRTLGVEYLLPGEDWIEIPSRSDIRSVMSEAVFPEFDHIAIMGSGTYGITALGLGNNPVTEGWLEWYRHAGFPHGTRMSCGHTDANFLISDRAALQADPLTVAAPLHSFCRNPQDPQDCHAIDDGQGNISYRSYLPSNRRANEGTQMHHTHHGTVSCSTPGAIVTYRDPQGVSYCEDPDDYSSYGGAMGLFTNYVLAEIARRRPAQPELVSVSTEPNDGAGHCHCQKCTDLLRNGPYGHTDRDSSLSDRVFHRTNMVAQRVATTHPDMGVCQYAYAHHAAVPAIPIESNVTVAVSAYTFHHQYTRMSDEELLDAWEQKARTDGISLSVYDNWCIADFDHNTPGCSFDFVATRVRDWHSRGIRAPQGQTSWSIGAHGPQFYLLSKLAWDINVDDEAVLDDFFSKAFGPAAVPMQRMIERWNLPNFRLNSYELALAYRDLLEADSLTTEVRYANRIDAYKHYVHFMRRLLEYYETAVSGAPRAPALDALVEQMWRAWQVGMVEGHRLHDLFIANPSSPATPALRAYWNKEDVNAPGWARLRQPFDLDATIAAGAQAYPVAPNYLPVAFSNNLVPLNPNPPAGPAVNGARFTSSQTFAFFARAGRPVTFSILAQASNPDRHPHLVQVRDAQGTVIRTQDAPIGIGTVGPIQTDINLGVLPEGLYRVSVREFMGASAHMYWIRSPADLHFVQEGPYLISANQPSERLYFYVPAGTSEMFMSAAYTSTPVVYAPDGTPVAVRTGRAALSFDTPVSGVWSIDRINTVAQAGRALFVNAPTVVAYSPNQMLVPAELLAGGCHDPNELVPLTANPRPGTEVTTAYYGTTQDFAFLARSGQNVTFAVEARAAHPGAAPHEVIVQRPDGTILHRQDARVGSSGNYIRTAVALGVLPEGLYTVRLRNSLGSANMYRLAIPSDLHFVQRGAPNLTALQNTRFLYFYVPAGTAQLTIGGSPLVEPVFMAPDGTRMTATLDSATNLRTIITPLSTRATGGIWAHNYTPSLPTAPLSVTNAPAYVAYSPEQLLVPRTVIGAGPFCGN